MAVEKGVAPLPEGERAAIDFKREFDPNDGRQWCELIKDLVAMANTGGGCIIIGCEDDGSPSGRDISAAMDTDPAVFGDKIQKYTGAQAVDLSLAVGTRGDKPVLIVQVEESAYPVVFAEPGTYSLPDNKQRTVFSKGQVYFRHGAKSEPGTADDLRRFVDRRLAQIRDEWLSNIRKVVEAPVGAVVTVSAVDVGQPGAVAPIAARLVNAPDAAPVAWRSPDETHPYRAKEAVREINRRLDGRATINAFDVRVLRTRFNMDGDPNLIYKPKYGSAQYSTAFVDWVIGEFEKDQQFFQRVRGEVRALGH